MLFWLPTAECKYNIPLKSPLIAQLYPPGSTDRSTKILAQIMQHGCTCRWHRQVQWVHQHSCWQPHTLARGKVIVHQGRQGGMGSKRDRERSGRNRAFLGAEEESEGRDEVGEQYLAAMALIFSFWNLSAPFLSLVKHKQNVNRSKKDHLW